MKNNETVFDKTTITHSYPILNGIRYHYAEAGDGPLVVMIHGFPELWYSWRHQLTALAEAGYHAVAPDLRGFGESEVSANVKDYSLLQHASDVKALIDHVGVQEATIIGHDWGANIMWIMPMLYPQTVKAVASLSIPFYPEPRDPSRIKSFGSGKFNQFREPGVTESEFNEDPARFLRLFFYGLSGDAPPGTVDTLFMGKFPDDAKLLDGFPEPESLPGWLSPHDLDYYVNAYKKTGITGALGFYRNMADDYPALKELYREKITQPVLFIGGGVEPAVKYGSLDPMKAALPNMRNALVLPGCGHWLQQERPAAVNAAIIDFLNAEVRITDPSPSSLRP
ncbi:MAG TPA: alpha/beta hydrolase [Cyclobacteriaceae bacterium]|nr:alpha/beta hydrolase [Cyclobacteriaceae bacterium]